MSVTREQVADLQVGDVVELTFATGSIVRGPLVKEWSGGLGIAQVGWSVRSQGGAPAHHMDEDVVSLTVVSRAPRPLYVNHDRTKPVPGDVVRDADDENSSDTWTYTDPDDQYADGEPWISPGAEPWWVAPDRLPAHLRLLVDGETGQVVP